MTKEPVELSIKALTKYINEHPEELNLIGEQYVFAIKSRYGGLRFTIASTVFNLDFKICFLFNREFKCIKVKNDNGVFSPKSGGEFLKTCRRVVKEQNKKSIEQELQEKGFIMKFEEEYND